MMFITLKAKHRTKPVMSTGRDIITLRSNAPGLETDYYQHRYCLYDIIIILLYYYLSFCSTTALTCVTQKSLKPATAARFTLLKHMNMIIHQVLCSFTCVPFTFSWKLYLYVYFHTLMEALLLERWHPMLNTTVFCAFLHILTDASVTITTHFFNFAH